MSEAVSNFEFLEEIDKQLSNLGRLAENYFVDDPSTSIIKLRQFCERLTQRHAAQSGINLAEHGNQIDLLRKLKFERAVPDKILDVLHHIRKTGNVAVHAATGDHRTALNALKMSVQLGAWHYRVVKKDNNFRAAAFIPPAIPSKPDADLQSEIERLRSERDKALSEAELAQELADRASKEAQIALGQFEKEKEAREVIERQLVLSSEEAKADLKQFYISANSKSVAEVGEFIKFANRAADALEIDESATREIIDQKLRDAGWEADTKTIRHSKGTRPAKGRNLAIAEWPTESGPADYALFVDLQCVGIVEAKRYQKNVSAAIDQAERYSKDIRDAQELVQLSNEFKVPFVFATNGRPYLKQVETESGIWFRDVRLGTNRRRALMDWYTPQGLLELLQVDKADAQSKLEAREFDFGFQLRPYQKAAIQAVEKTLSSEQREMLVAMATGTGKTKLAIAMLYRLLSTKRFRRICFVVDRSALGNQTRDEFMSTQIEGPKTFGQLFNLKGLEEVKPDPETRVHICTIQGLVKRVLYAENPEDAPPIDQYDLIVIDECHRGYLLDREMSDAELSFRGQDDYISKYRRVLEYFDAVKIGLTATPALHTAEIFGDPIYTYTYREAVIDGWLIDHEPPTQIRTALTKSGIVFDANEEVEFVETKTGELQSTNLPDELNFQIEGFNRKVITRNFNKAVAEELVQHIDPSLEGKTLIFAVTDAHADILVDELKKAYEDAYGEIEDSAIKKITGSVDKVGKLIRSYRNDAMPKIAVTVDLLTTGIDVPSITNLVFVRRVNSRILYEQMIGRATRRCDEIGKDVFRIFDAVDLYASLSNVTTMKPVASNPKLSFETLFEELETVEGADAQNLVRDQILAKLNRKLRKLPSKTAEELQQLTGKTAQEIRDHIKESNTGNAIKFAKQFKEIGKILDWDPDDKSPNYIPISYHDDEVVEVTTGYGEATKPEDYLDTFSSFIKNNLNEIAALKIVVQRPRELTRAQLRELRLELDKLGFNEPTLRKAWSETTNEDITASIIGFVRQAAIGDPLVPFEQRVENATKAILSKQKWTDPQKQWLNRISQQIAKEVVVDRDALDAGQFAASGGFHRLNKVFKGELESILNDFNEEMWKTPA